MLEEWDLVIDRYTCRGEVREGQEQDAEEAHVGVGSECDGWCYMLTHAVVGWEICTISNR